MGDTRSSHFSPMHTMHTDVYLISTCVQETAPAAAWLSSAFFRASKGNSLLLALSARNMIDGARA